MCDVVGVTELAERLGVPQQRISMRIYRSKGAAEEPFPEPDYTVSGRAAWEWATVRGFAEEAGWVEASGTSGERASRRLAVPGSRPVDQVMPHRAELEARVVPVEASPVDLEVLVRELAAGGLRAGVDVSDELGGPVLVHVAMPASAREDDWVLAESWVWWALRSAGVGTGVAEVRRLTSRAPVS